MQSSGHRVSWLSMSFTLLCITALASGCSRYGSSNSTNEASRLGTDAQSALKSGYVEVDNSTYDLKSETVTLRVHETRVSHGIFRRKSPAGEQVIDVATKDGPINYACTKYSTEHITAVLLISGQHTRTIRIPSDLTTPEDYAQMKTAPQTGDAISTLSQTDALEALSGSLLPRGASRSGHVPIPPPGAKIDRTIYWRVKLTAPVWMKENAVINEARSKLGTPYIWGHNEDRGQYGFDCSNFTAYVYHHALGYKFTGASRGQAKYVGVSIPISDMRRGDLIIFEHGKHVGIYAGKHRMIQEGGGIGKVGYLSLGPKSYWGKHITSVKRLF